MISKWIEAGWTLHSLGSTTDATGNPIDGYSTGTAISGRFRPLSGDRKLSADRQTPFADAKFYCSSTSTIAVGDQLRKSSEVYEVTWVQNPMDMDRFLQVEAKKI